MPAIDLPVHSPAGFINTTPPPPISAYLDSPHLNNSQLSEFYQNFSLAPPEIILKPKTDNSTFRNLIEYLFSYFFNSEKDKGKKKKYRKRLTDTTSSTSTPCKQSVQQSHKVFADYHVNKEVQSIRQSSVVCKGKKFPEIVNNGYQILDENGEEAIEFSAGNTGFATKDRPKTGFTSLNDPHYIEWQINTARAAGIDGFVVEWGYPNSKSSGDIALKQMKSILNMLNRGEGFSVVPVFIPTWLDNSWNDKSSDEKITLSKKKLNELLDQYYQDRHCPRINHDPMLFMLNFYGAHNSDIILNANELTQLFNSDQKLKNSRIAFRMGNEKHRWKASENPQIVSDYPWLPPRPNDAFGNNDSFVESNFYKFGTHKNIESYQKKLSGYNNDHKDNLPIKTLPVTPGIDTRYMIKTSCNSYIPDTENGKSTLEYSWEAARKENPDLVIVETYNDYTEGTHIEPSTQKGSTNAVINAEQSCLFKGGSEQSCKEESINARKLIEQSTELFKSRTLADKLKVFYTDSDKLERLEKNLNSWSLKIYKKNLAKAQQRQKKVMRSFEAIPYFKFNRIIKNIDYRTIGNNQTKFKLSNILNEDHFSRDNQFTEADLQIQISRRDKNAVSPIVIQSKLSSSTEVVGKFFLSSDLEEATVRLPLNNHDGKLKGKLSRNYSINHPGYDVTIKEIRVQSYKSQ